MHSTLIDSLVCQEDEGSQENKVFRRVLKDGWLVLSIEK